MVCKYYIFLIHSSVVGHEGCFHNLAIIKSARMNKGEHISLHSPGRYLGVELLGHMVGVLLMF